MRLRRSGFSLIELLVSIAIIAVLVGILLPTLIFARDSSRAAVCAGNLKQVGLAWSQYLDDHQQFPRHTEVPDWKYGGVKFPGESSAPVLAADRPINRYLADERSFDSRSLAFLYRCPSDKGVYERGGPIRQPRESILDGRTCFEYFGTSYRANPYLLDAYLAGVDPRQHRPLKRHEVWVAESRLLVLADAAWYYSTRPPESAEAHLDASWHTTPDAGNMLAADGSIRFMHFVPGETDRYALLPRPGLTSPGPGKTR
jgi:prepilin-type N-terminal cleavage/methylation domain-containing protein